ncbi:MAG: hypothetical protein NC817_00900 [Candidatus Omnitrophica bacterium]|nr:hypothetical protein [Candidatus Omnitrophota bacterium]MCM8826411.1 hypothetical protein [Candidatus Omnitrophota bacterium]
MRLIFVFLVITVSLSFLFLFLISILARIRERRESTLLEEDFSFDDEGLKKDMEELHSLINHSLEIIREEKKSIEQAKRELIVLLEDSKRCIQKLEELNLGIHKQGELIKKDRDEELVYSLINQGLSIEDIAQRLNMGIAELRLKLSLWDKNGLHNAHRR